MIYELVILQESWVLGSSRASEIIQFGHDEYIILYTCDPDQIWQMIHHRERGFVGDASMVIGRFWNLTLQYPCDVTLTAGRVIVIVPYSFRSIAVVPRSQWPWVGRTIPFRESIQKDSCAEWQDHHDLYWRSPRPTYGSQDAQPTPN